MATDQPLIDVHTHAMPLPLLHRLERDGLVDLSRLGQEVIQIDPRLSGLPPAEPIPCVPAQHRVDDRLRLMDATGASVHLVSTPPFLLGQDLTDPDRAAPLLRYANDALAEFAAVAPDRLQPLAAIRPGLPGAEAEARRCLTELGFAGVSIGSRGFGGELDHPDHEPLWRWLAGTGTFTLLHPGGGPAPDRLAGVALTQLLGFPLETMLATARLILGGVLDRHDLRLCVCHGGSCVAAVAPRLDLGWRHQPATHTTEHLPTAYLRRLYFDTALCDARQLRRLVAEVGGDRVLLGTDAPFGLADRRPRETVAELGLDPADERAILGGTVAGLLPQVAVR